MKRKDSGQCFVSKQRPDGKVFYHIKDGAPEELIDLIRKIHFDHFYGCGPNDWIYEEVRSAFHALEIDEIDDVVIEADVMDWELIKWLQEPFALSVCDEAREEFEVNGALLEQIAYGQWHAKDKIYHAVNDFIEADKGEE